MKSTPLIQHSALTVVSAATAAIAALALTACGPRDSVETAAPATGATATAQMQTAATDPAQLTRGQGLPVPPAAGYQLAPATMATTPPAALAPGPAYAPPPPLNVARTQPGDPAQPSYPAQSSYPLQPAPAGYAPPSNYVVERPAAESPAVDRSRIGSVASIEPIRERPGGTGAGAVIGGVLGAVVGNRFGHGSGRAAMTGVGAVGGAVVGNNLERNHREAINGYRVSIRLDNGTMRSFERNQIGALQVGDRVRLDAGTFRRV